MNSLSHRFSIENNQLTNFEGKVFPSIQYESELHSQLVYRLQDPDLGRVIYQAYHKHIKNTLSENETIQFEKALLRVSLLFGCAKFPPQLGLKVALREENFPVTEWMENNSESFKQFMEEANPNLYPSRQPKKNDLIKHIVITTTTAAGGNVAVAEGLKKLLEGSYKVTVIDVEKLSEEVDPIKTATGTHTFDKIYAEIIQQQNQFNEGFDLQMNVGQKIAQYIQPTLGKVLKQKIAALDADFILSTRNGHELDLSLSPSLGIPGSIIHCDCEVAYYYKDFVGKVESQLFKIWLPENHTRVFKPVIDRIGKEWNQYENKPWEIYKTNLASSLHIPIEQLEQQIEFVGAPVRPEIKKIKESVQINQLKEKWDLNIDEKSILVILGQNGVGKMKNIFDDLLHSPTHQTSIKYYFVCGMNQQLKEEFENKLQKDLSQTALKRCSILGYLSGKEINELLNISTFVLGKPGGSQKEECLKIAIPMMIVFSHEYWESGNQAKLERENFALSYNPADSLAKQTEAHIKALQEQMPQQPKRMKWKNLIPAAIQKSLNEFYLGS